jgi:phosphatidylserine/phosphatidylglycerophosphate/cardiolipin synthase-like enzyme
MSSALSVKTWIACALNDASAITQQADGVAHLLADFIAAAQQTVHIAIYDFRLDSAQATVVMGALNAAADRGLDVRVAYFEQPPRKNTEQDGGDPSPGTKASNLKALHPKVAIKAIKSIDVSNLPKGVKKEPIEGGGHLMHSKYIVRDGTSVLTGSANFTTDAWSIQDNNLIELTSPGIAACYQTDFDELWANGRIAGTGKNDLGTASVDGYAVDVAFSPGEGSTVEKEIAGAIQGARESVAIASMVISSGAILGALIDAIGRGVKVTGVYDGTEMKMVLNDFKKGTKSAGKVAQWTKVAEKLVAKWSIPYAPTSPHNFMHNKLAAVDGKVVVSGSFNFSQNATMNAENLLTIREPAIVQQYEAYVAQLVSTYRKMPAAATARAPGKAKAKKARAPRKRAHPPRAKHK